MDSKTFLKLQTLFEEWREASVEVQPSLESQWSENIPELWAHLSPLIAIAKNELDSLHSKALASEENPLRHLQKSKNELNTAVPKVDRQVPRMILPEIPGFQIKEILGEGGMGVVYRARQEAVNGKAGLRDVALKVLKQNFSDPQTCDRLMQLEMKIHANLTTPYVASFFNGGMAPNGQCYFAMELVEGPTIIDYAVENKLTIHQRLELFLQLCDGVANAHQHRIVHGDLTPSNVLVAPALDGPKVKIIDFGIADFLFQEPEENNNDLPKKRFGKRFYIPPESFDTKYQLNFQTDVYALGVLLFELLVGYPLFEPKLFGDLSKSQQWALIRSGVCENASEMLSRHKNADTREVRTIRGDLDAIVAKALEHDLERRYFTVTDLARDVRGMFEHQVVSARRTPLWVQTWKFFRRHTVAVSLGILILLTMLYSAVHSQIQQKQTREALSRLQANFKFFEDLLTSPHPIHEGSEVRVIDVLAKGEEALNHYGTVDPELEVRIRTTIGEVYFGLGLYVQALKQYDQALISLAQQMPNNELTRAHIRDRQARALRNLDHFQRAEEVFQLALDGKRKVLGDHHPSYNETLLGLASVQLNQGHYTQATKLSETAWLGLLRTLGPENEKVLDAQVFLANARTYSKQLNQAIRTLENVWNLQKRQYSPRHPRVLIVQQNLANALLKAQQFSAAVTHYEDIIAHRNQVLKHDHPLTLNSRHGYALALIGLGQLTEAKAVLADLLPDQVQKRGATHWRTLISQNSYARVLGQLNHVTKAIELLQDLVIKYDEDGKGRSTQALKTKNNLSHFLREAGRCDESLQLITEVLEIKRSRWGPNDPSALISLISLGEVWEALGQPIQALDCYEKALAPVAAHHPRRPFFRALYARCLMSLGHVDPAEAMLKQSLAESEEGQGDYAQIHEMLLSVYQRPGVSPVSRVGGPGL